jgi:hypothetical protein
MAARPDAMPSLSPGGGMIASPGSARKALDACSLGKEERQPDGHVPARRDGVPLDAQHVRT